MAGGRFQGDLPVRTYRFGLSVLHLMDLLPQGTKGWVIGRQLLRSATSVGANTQEADAALTDAEFASICNIARREALESRFWLRMCKDAGLLSPDSIDSCIAESDELVRILSTIVRKTREHIATS